MDYLLSKIFIDVYNNTSRFYGDKNKRLVVEDYELLEKTLEDYVIQIFGYKVKQRYNEYFQEIAKSFENIVINCDCINFSTTIESIKKYSMEFNENINKYKKVSIFIKAVKELYATGSSYPVVSNIKNSYYISMPSKNEENVPSIYIKDIEKFENVLNEFIESIINSNTKFKEFYSDFDDEEVLSYLFKWIVINASLLDLNDISKYFKKYSRFISDTTLECVNHPLKLGKILEDDLYVARRKADVNYETPYYLCFFVNGENRKVELPNIRLGIDKETNKAYILATQTAQNPYSVAMNEEYNKVLKQYLPKTKDFREYNPSHMTSLILSFGFLKSLGIDTIEVVDFLPLRYQRLVVENRKNEEELHNYQYRLTNKNLYNYFRMLEFQEGITITNYPDGGSNLTLKIGDVKFNDPFLQNLYETAYHSGLEIVNNNSKKI